MLKFLTVYIDTMMNKQAGLGQILLCRHRSIEVEIEEPNPINQLFYLPVRWRLEDRDEDDLTFLFPPCGS